MLLPPVYPEAEMALAAGLGPFISHPDREVPSSPPIQPLSMVGPHIFPVAGWGCRFYCPRQKEQLHLERNAAFKCSSSSASFVSRKLEMPTSKYCVLIHVCYLEDNTLQLNKGLIT